MIATTKNKCCMMIYISGFFEKLWHALSSVEINLIIMPPARKLKNVISAKIAPVPQDEIFGVYIIPFFYWKRTTARIYRDDGSIVERSDKWT